MFRDKSKVSAKSPLLHFHEGQFDKNFIVVLEVMFKLGTGIVPN